MKRTTFLIAAVLFLCSWNNPLTYTDIPDNDVIRVGKDYYMISTTMYYCPGAPIMHSRDLVHWKIVNYIYDCLEDNDIYNLRDGLNAYGKGQWATSLRYHDGKYYALFIANEQPDNSYLFTTDDIRHGKWTRTTLPLTMHDASLLFDNDGRLYSIYGNGDLYITELEPDGSALKEGGINRLLLRTPSEGYMLRAEGAHFYHIGDYYYILVIDWPVDGIRTETCWRSKNLLGPYESRTVLQGAFDGRSDGVAQGSIVDTPDGHWYAIMFQDHGAVGRIPTLQRVTWEDGWPVMGNGGVPEKTFEHGLKLRGKDYVWDSDGFGGKVLKPVWQWNHKPLDGCWSLTDRPGWLRLSTGQKATSIMDARNSLTQRAVGPMSRTETLLDASGLREGDYAGICAFQSHNCCIGIEVGISGERWVVVRETRPEGSGKWKTSDVYRAKADAEKVYLGIDYDFTTDKAVFSYSFDGRQWTSVNHTLDMKFTLDLFTGYRSALFCYSTAGTGGYADFGWFRQRVTAPQ